MRFRLRNTVMLAILATCSALAFAQTPSRVGRISLAQGQVNIGGEVGEQVDSAVVNWPVTSRNQVTTGRDSRTEIRIGSTAVRLDADSAMDVTELDDDTLRLHLHYGSAIIRLRTPEAANGFELSTPQGVVRMQQPGRMRVDAGRSKDTTLVSVFDGIASVDGGGSRLTVRQGRMAELGMDDIRTGQARRDGFDDWANLRDERDDRSESVRYVTREMTGYEDLDQYGSWRDDAEYGPLWAPTRIASDWVPYRDGRWTYLQPWGWTWVDNAPWGYAPFHYGRWVTVSNRWYWAPGRNVSRVIWSPALVGWVGGDNWNVSFQQSGSYRQRPARGWYPLSPRDTYKPSYRTSHEHLNEVNRFAGTPSQDMKRGYGTNANQRRGLTVVPQENFSQRGTIAVRNTRQPVVTPSILANAPMFVPPPVITQRDRRDDDRNDGRRGDRGDRRNDDRVRVERSGVMPAVDSAVSQAVRAANRANEVPVIGNAQLPPTPMVDRRDGRNDDQRRRGEAPAPAQVQADAQAQFRQQQAQQLQTQQAQADQVRAQQQQAQAQMQLAQQQQALAVRAQAQAEARAELDRDRRRGPESNQPRPQFQPQFQQQRQEQPRQEQPRPQPQQQAPASFARPTQEAAIAPTAPPPPRQSSEQREQRRQLREELNDKR